MDPLLQLLVAVLIFAIIAYGLYWVCTAFKLPIVVLWICGAILLIIILLWARGQLGGGAGPVLRLGK